MELKNIKNLEISQLVGAWQDFLATADRHTLIQGVTPKDSGCGLIYELPNFLNRANESFAIADMGHIPFSML